MRKRAIETALGYKLASDAYVRGHDHVMLFPLMTFLPYWMDRKSGTERTWYFQSREYGALGDPFATGTGHHYFNTRIEITPEIATELAVPDVEHAVRGSDGKVSQIQLHHGRFDPSEDRAQWRDYLKRMRVLLQLIEKEAPAERATAGALGTLHTS